MVIPYLGKQVLEVGAGIGASTGILLSMSAAEYWLCLEPDPENLSALREAKRKGDLPGICDFKQGTLLELDPGQRFDSILYVDVLEHIEQDEAEIRRAAGHLSPGGHLTILAPAYPFLFSEFDRAIGHHRRYTRAMFADSHEPSLHMTYARYLDSVGLLASLANRIMLRSPLPSKRQLAFWDRVLIPISRRVDKLIGYRFGRSILVVYQNMQQKHGS
jgi:2-polyprenyl-3-methyl-5-hydroxy-6-metoxy-1,4-benzoquinol methylase